MQLPWILTCSIDLSNMQKIGQNSSVFLALSLVKVTQNYVNLENFGVCHRKQPCPRDAPPRFRHRERSCCTFDPLFPWTEAHFPPIQPDASLQNGTGSHLHAKNSNLRVSHPMVTVKHSQRQTKSQIINIPIFRLPLKPVFHHIFGIFCIIPEFTPFFATETSVFFFFPSKTVASGAQSASPSRYRSEAKVAGEESVSVSASVSVSVLALV